MSAIDLAQKLMVSSTFAAAAAQRLAIPSITVVPSTATSEAYLELDEAPPALQWNAGFIARCSHFELCVITAHAMGRYYVQRRQPSAPEAAREACADYVCGWLCARFAAGPLPYQLEVLEALLEAIPGLPHAGGRSRTRHFVQGWCDQVDPAPSLHLLEQ